MRCSTFILHNSAFLLAARRLMVDDEQHDVISNRRVENYVRVVRVRWGLDGLLQVAVRVGDENLR